MISGAILPPRRKKVAIFPFAANNGLVTGETPKAWPYFKELVEMLSAKGVECHQFCASEPTEYCDTVFRNTPLSKLHAKVKEYDTFVSVDSFYQHMNHCGDKKIGVVIFTVSDPKIYGYPYNKNILKDEKYLRNNQYLLYRYEDLNRNACPEPHAVFEAVMSLLE